METPIRPIPDNPRPGDFGLSIIGGKTGFFVRIAQAVIGDTSRYTHAWLVIDEQGTVVEAQPGGARLTTLDAYRGQDIYYHNAYYLTDEQRARIAEIGSGFEGVPYSYMDYLALGLTHLGLAPKWMRRYVTNSRRMICSQLVDEALRQGGYCLFDDGRLPQDVTPGDLFWNALRRDLAKP